MPRKSKPDYEAILGRLIEALPDSIYVKDAESRFQFSSFSMARKFGASGPADIIGKTDADYFAAEHANEARADELALLRGESSVNSKLEKETWPDGRITWVRSTKVAYYDKDGNPQGIVGISHDVTEEKALEKKLSAAKRGLERKEEKQSEELRKAHEVHLENFKKIVAHVPAAIWMGDENERTVYANELFCNIVEYSLEEIIGLESYVFWTQESIDRVKKNNTLRVKGESSVYEGDLKSKTGKIVPVRLTGIPLANGGTVGMMIDLREARSEQLEKESLRKLLDDNRLLGEYKHALEESTMILRYDAAGIIQYVNDAFCAASGYERRELVGNHYHMIVDEPEKVEKGRHDKIQSNFADAKVWHGVIRNRRKDGSRLWTNTTVVPMRDANGQVTELLGVKMDITDQMEAERKVQDQLSFLETMLDAIPYPVFYKDSLTRFVGVNGAFLRIMGKVRDEVIGKTVWDLFPSVLAARYDAMDRELLNDVAANNQVYEYMFVDASGAERAAIFNKTKYFDAEGKVKGLIGITVDISQMRRAQDELKKAYDELKALDQKKTDFLNIASHELRTPLTSIKGYVSMAIDGDYGDLPLPLKKPLETVMLSSSRLITLVNDMLDVAKLEAGKMEFREVELDLSQALREAYEENLRNGMVTAKRLRFRIEGPGGKIMVKTDPDKLRQVVVNLVGNAFKFTPEDGSVTVRWSAKDGRARVEVSDSGIGIKPEDFDKIFEKFGQVDNVMSRQYGGTGLGLPIVREIVRRMGGDISVESSLGKGSTFRFWIPAMP